MNTKKSLFLVLSLAVFFLNFSFSHVAKAAYYTSLYQAVPSFGGYKKFVQDHFSVDSGGKGNLFLHFDNVSYPYHGKEYVNYFPTKFKFFVPPVFTSNGLNIYMTSVFGYSVARLNKDPDCSYCSTDYKDIPDNQKSTKAKLLEDAANFDIYSYNQLTLSPLGNRFYSSDKAFGWVYVDVYKIKDGDGNSLGQSNLFSLNLYSMFSNPQSFMDWFNSIQDCSVAPVSDSICWGSNGDPVVRNTNNIQSGSSSSSGSSSYVPGSGGPAIPSTNPYTATSPTIDPATPSDPADLGTGVIASAPYSPCSPSNLSACTDQASCSLAGGTWDASAGNCIASSATVGASSTTATVAISNPIGTDEITSFFQSIIERFQGIIAILAILFLVISGVTYLTSGGSQKRITLAKAAFVASLLGFTLALAAPSFLKQIKEILLADGTTMPTTLDDALTLSEIVERTLSFLLSIFGILAIISFVTSSVVYFSSFGDSQKAQQAKTALVYSIVGIVVALGSLILVKQIAAWF